MLHGVDLDVPPGTTVALVGHTGAGKSTIAKLLARFYDPTEGRIAIDGVDLREVTQESLRRRLGIVPQEASCSPARSQTTSPSGGPMPRDEEVVAAARAVGADEFVERLEDRYDTELQERGSRLSLGQRQLVAFARALLADPRILILDEATSSVDIGTERQIEQALRRLLAGRTAFIIAHRLSTIRDADLIVVLEHGRVAETGTHDELLARGTLYSHSTATGPRSPERRRPGAGRGCRRARASSSDGTAGRRGGPRRRGPSRPSRRARGPRPPGREQDAERRRRSLRAREPIGARGLPLSLK